MVQLYTKKGLSEPAARQVVETMAVHTGESHATCGARIHVLPSALRHPLTPSAAAVQSSSWTS